MSDKPISAPSWPRRRPGPSGGDAAGGSRRGAGRRAYLPRPAGGLEHRPRQGTGIAFQLPGDGDEPTEAAPPGLASTRSSTERRVRPTLMAPLWRLAGFALGASTALMGEKAAHACTEAVETVIEDHYAHQIAELGAREPALAAELSQFRDDELAHRDQAVAEGAKSAPALSAIGGGDPRGAARRRSRFPEKAVDLFSFPPLRGRGGPGDVGGGSWIDTHRFQHTARHFSPERFACSVPSHEMGGKTRSAVTPPAEHPSTDSPASSRAGWPGGNLRPRSCKSQPLGRFMGGLRGNMPGRRAATHAAALGCQGCSGAQAATIPFSHVVRPPRERGMTMVNSVVGRGLSRSTGRRSRRAGRR